MLFMYLDSDKYWKRKDISRFYNVREEGDYYVFNTRNDIDILSKNFKGSLNVYKPNIYLKLKAEKNFNIDNYIQILKYYKSKKKILRKFKKV